ncbi:hypothetical protein BC943DRAFT_91242 [Umbelopsis sp. AD052]|nr:hypothetical protein BC943DRAFT_91242 [Umbelopsis sp. AD052]
MDPYEQTQSSASIPDDFVDDDEHFRELETELAPKDADYYGILNISKQATEDEIKDSYKRLCRVFHPDKHTDPEKKKAAEAQFQSIQKAYEVLVHPTKRILYDTYGEQGLKGTMEVGPKLKTPEEMRAEYEKQARLKREQDLENLVRSKGEFQVNLDATQVFDPYEPPVFSGFGGPPKQAKRSSPLGALSRAQVQQLFMKHSFETQVGPATHAVIAGSMVSRGGMGGGNIIGTIRHTVSPRFWVEGGANLLRPRALTFKTYFNVSSDSFINTTSQARTIYAPPVLTVTAGRRIASAATGYITYRTGEWNLGEWGRGVGQGMDKSSFALGIAGQGKRKNYSAEIQTGIVASHLALDYTYRMVDSTRIRVGGSLSTVGGIMASIGSDHRLTKHSRFGMAMECGVPSGVVAKFKVTRLGQKIVIPIVLSGEFNIRLAFWGSVVPASIAVIADHFVLKPRRKQRLNGKIQELREEHADYLAQRKTEAEQALLILSDIAGRKMKSEETKHGLVIIEARYGKKEGNDDMIDVTVAIQALVNDSKLTIPGGHAKSNILGFHDPCLGEAKHLVIKYRFQHRLHEVTVDDTAPVACPLRSHIV